MPWRKAVAMLAIAGSLAACAPAMPLNSTNQDAASTRRNADRVKGAFDRWAAGSGDFFEDLLAPDVRWTIRGSGPIARTYAGREVFLDEAVKPFAVRLMRPVLPRVRHLIAQGDVVIAVWDGESMARDGVPYRNSYVWVFCMSGDKAIEVEAYLDLEPYYDVLRRVPPP